ncbi:hypothetical protein RhiXN_06162 [Rhizoctonia solani]|uniref:Uncharacterized protein n=1 Tax=Rhizoctonia solani TaxID=456999 RepID=A0A8H8NZJ1_9AGAM|nr:uncharacterized protein RhiXN_06162 [Rhizoctonia solani]QRW21173.1 hypothetical protein RhiXN_06162 [Rhizoctonia solani]
MPPRDTLEVRGSRANFVYSTPKASAREPMRGCPRHMAFPCAHQVFQVSHAVKELFMRDLGEGKASKRVRLLTCAGRGAEEEVMLIRIINAEAADKVAHPFAEESEFEEKDDSSPTR